MSSPTVRHPGATVAPGCPAGRRERRWPPGRARHDGGGAAAWSLAVLPPLSACTVGADFAHPRVDAPAAIGATAADVAKVVLQAWHDVDNALVAYAETQHRRTDAAATRAADARALTAADQQYRAGATSLLDVIAAQEGVLRGENTVAQAQADLALRLIDLYRALGGGWQAVPDAPPTGGVTPGGVTAGGVTGPTQRATALP